MPSLSTATQYVIRLRSLSAMTCFLETVRRLQHGDDADTVANVDPAHFSAYFRALRDRVTVAELNRTDDDRECDTTQCRFERVLASDCLLVADSPSTAIDLRII